MIKPLLSAGSLTSAASIASESATAATTAAAPARDLVGQTAFERLARQGIAHTPEWTNLNDGDPGVTHVEVFGWLGESIAYRTGVAQAQRTSGAAVAAGVAGGLSVDGGRPDAGVSVSPGLALRPDGSTLQPDPEWKYVNVRRYLTQLEESIGKGIDWAVFEPNDEPLWARVRATVSDLLMRDWQSGALQGTRPDQAFFVKCDRSTMTQDDIDNGRLVVEVGVATVKPAEFVILRISSKAATDPD
jgi:hypothetical protein